MVSRWVKRNHGWPAANTKSTFCPHLPQPHSGRPSHLLPSTVISWVPFALLDWVLFPFLLLLPTKVLAFENLLLTIFSLNAMTTNYWSFCLILCLALWHHVELVPASILLNFTVRKTDPIIQPLPNGGFHSSDVLACWSNCLVEEEGKQKCVVCHLSGMGTWRQLKK